MKYLIFSAGFLFMLSCGSNGNAPVSNPVDSTNAVGSPPVDYSPDNNEPMLPDADQGSGHRANTPNGDSVPSKRGRK